MLRHMMEKVVIAGTGISAAVTASLLREQLGPACQILLLDKARGAGGRMSTSRCPDDNKTTVDLGAQYISAYPEYLKKHEKLYEELLSAEVLQPVTGLIEGENDHPFYAPPEGTKHYMTPTGISSLVKYFINKSGAEAKFQNHITDVSLDESGSKWRLTTQKGDSETCDCVILTMPVPQILQLQGTVKKLIDDLPEEKRLLEKVSYSSRFALGLFYKPGTKIDVPWAAKYFYDDECIRFVSIDNRKRGTESADLGPSICVHTGVPFSLKHLEVDKDEMTPVIMEHLKKSAPELPKPDSIKSLKWRYSQVHKGYEGSPGCIVLQEKPLLILAGDGFIRSKFDCCVDSAIQVASKIKNQMKASL